LKGKIFICDSLFRLESGVKQKVWESFFSKTGKFFLLGDQRNSLEFPYLGGGGDGWDSLIKNNKRTMVKIIKKMMNSSILII